jgi:type I restriction enzyme S subunit
VKKNSVLIALAGQGKTRGTVAINRVSLTTNQSIAAIVPDNTIHYEFIFQSLFRRYDELRMMSSGDGTRGGLNKQLISDVLIVCPNIEEQQQIGSFFSTLDRLITLHQRKLEHLKERKKGLLQKMFPKNGEVYPEIRFPGFTDAWEQRKLGEEFERVNERNDGSFGKEHWISVAKMYFQDPEVVQSNNIDTRTYVMREGDIAFEGHSNSEFKYGRFVVNDIGDGVVSELFPIYRHKVDFDNNYWKRAIQLEWIMAPIFANSITSSGNSSNKLEPGHFLRQTVYVPNIEEQHKIGLFFTALDNLITLHQRKLKKLQNMKKALLEKCLYSEKIKSADYL